MDEAYLHSRNQFQLINTQSKFHRTKYLNFKSTLEFDDPDNSAKSTNLTNRTLLPENRKYHLITSATFKSQTSL